MVLSRSSHGASVTLDGGVSGPSSICLEAQAVALLPEIAGAVFIYRSRATATRPDGSTDVRE
jgi:hypothetical protein